MKFGTMGIVGAATVAMIGAALAYHLFIKQPAVVPVERSVAQNPNLDKTDNENSNGAERISNTDSLNPQRGRLTDSQTDRAAVRGVVQKSGETGVKKTGRLAKLSEGEATMSDAGRFQMGEKKRKLRDDAETSKLDGPSPMRRPKFDVIRVAPDGVSVFAGQAEPGASVTVILNGRSVGEAVADGDGAWSVVTVITEYSEDMELILQARKGSKLVAEIEKPVIVEKIIISESARSTAKSAKSRLRTASKGGNENPATNPRSEKKLRILDDKTVIRKVEDKDNVKLALGPKIDPPKKTAGGKPIIVETKQEGVLIASPVPINFVYREAIFTEDGKKAVAALLEFVMKKKLSKIVLSGHTDERGSEEFNMNLSENRLVAVSTFLRSHGFKGEIVLRPMGEIRPMQIRNSEGYTREEIWQFNRRVELEGSE